MIGLIARAVMWVCVIFIVGNAVVQVVHDGNILLAIIMAVVPYPISTVIGGLRNV